MDLVESDTTLTTPDFIGNDEEKVNVLAYWSDMISLLRSINTTVVSIENKVAILDQLKKEVELLTLEVTNATSHPATSTDGSSEMKKDGDPEKDAPPVVDLSSPEDGNMPGAVPSAPVDPFAGPKITTTEQMRRLAGIWDKPKAPTKKPIVVEEPKVDQFAMPKLSEAETYKRLAGIRVK